MNAAMGLVEELLGTVSAAGTLDDYNNGTESTDKMSKLSG
jgi:hypothetical protein